MSNDLGQIGKMFKTNHTVFEKATQGVPAEKWLEQPGHDSNHLAWIVGHAVVHRALAARILGADWSAPWEKLFARVTQRVSSEQYPDAAELQRAWREVSEKLNAALPTASPDMLSAKVPEGRPSLDGTVGGSLALLCFHETFHVGQMSYLRKWLGYGQAVG
jgi:uncharacterized damage-inducible protein DinB